MDATINLLYSSCNNMCFYGSSCLFINFILEEEPFINGLLLLGLVNACKEEGSFIYIYL